LLQAEGTEREARRCAVYDAIIIGTRVAGATTAMLLARKGLKVLAVDRASFPSDTLSTNNIQLPGVARLERWGLLGQVAAAGTPAIRRVRFDPGRVVLEGSFPSFDGVDAVYGPRRTLLDTLLVEAAREAGAEVRERFAVDEITLSDGHVTGIRGGGIAEQARLVVGADGKHSLLAKTVKAATYEEQRPLSFGYYSYWDGVPVDGGEIYGRGRRLIGAWPTNDGLVMTYVAGPAEEFHEFRRDLEGNLLATLDLAGDLGERVRAGRRAERIYGSADLPNFFRTPFGPGWALVGDAGLTVDPITALGINDALRDAELLSNAIANGLGGTQPLEEALAGYQRERDRTALPMYRFTLDLAAMAPPRPEQEVLFRALAGRQDEIDRFLGVLACAVSPDDYFSPSNLRRLIGLRGFLAITRARIRKRRRDGHASTPLAADAQAAAPAS
jgi:2-polyprenyl-6-methoxyphenol hydroxylase-like FAD-dependent oxidoreductase